ncbi:MAG: flavoprotein, partial [Bacteriovoracaceae bacterium]
MRILLGICGSVSAYKSIELLRQYVKAGHEVKIILTRGATQFVRAELFHYLGAKAVYHFEDDFKYPNNDQKDPTKDSKSNVLHIELASWAEKLVIAPASANTIAKFAMG